jgi:hypothetical protein
MPESTRVLGGGRVTATAQKGGGWVVASRRGYRGKPQALTDSYSEPRRTPQADRNPYTEAHA